MKKSNAAQLLKAMRKQREQIQRVDARLRRHHFAAGNPRATGRLHKRSAR